MSRDLPIIETKVVEFLKRFEDASSTGLFANVVRMIHPDALFRFTDGDYHNSRLSPCEIVTCNQGGKVVD